MNDTDLTRQLATWVCERRFADLGDESVAQLERLLIDHLACASGGAYLPWGRNLVNWAAPYAGTGASRIIGSATSTSAPIAAFLNATAAHGMELDDTHDASLSHPGAAVMATALAVGADTNAKSEDILTAMAVGYEMTCRAGMATGASILEYGFHPTALFGGFGASAAAAYLYGLDSQGLEDAWGLLLSMIGGSAQFSQDPRGTVVKRLHGGFGAKNGILAAQLARQGLSGPARAFDGRFGLIALFGQGDSLPEKLDPDDGAPLAIHRISLKPYPCCRLFHSTIDAMREILGELPYADNDAITEIHVGGPNVLPEQHMIRRPESMMAAQYSLPYSIGAALERGPYDISAFEEETLAHPVREAIADKVSCVADEAMQAAFPDHFGTWIEFRFADGSSKRVEKLDSYGTPSAPMSTADIVSKADGLLNSTPIEMSGEKLASAVSRFVRAGDLPSLLERLVGPDA